MYVPHFGRHCHKLQCSYCDILRVLERKSPTYFTDKDVDRGIAPHKLRGEHGAIRPVNPVTFFPAPVLQVFFPVEPRYHS
jgi:hypothetical protein